MVICHNIELEWNNYYNNPNFTRKFFGWKLLQSDELRSHELLRPKTDIVVLANLEQQDRQTFIELCVWRYRKLLNLLAS